MLSKAWGMLSLGYAKQSLGYAEHIWGMLSKAWAMLGTVESASHGLLLLRETIEVAEHISEAEALSERLICFR
jgi:hypothetical protein